MSSALLFSSAVFVANADAAQHGRPGKHHPVAARPAHLVAGRHGHFVESHYAHHVGFHQFVTSRGRFFHHIHFASRRFALHAYHGISCVPYAREMSGIEVAGNAWEWWDNARGRYARGDRPEPGSVLNFRANGRMRLGHVAVVERVVNAREVMVDHANWPGGGGRGGVSENVPVVDVSEANDWSAVRVEMGRGGDFGSIYPTYGFIYNRPDAGPVDAEITRPAPMTAMNHVPSDLRPAAERPWHVVEEVAEAPDAPLRPVKLNVDAAKAGPGK